MGRDKHITTMINLLDDVGETLTHLEIQVKKIRHQINLMLIEESRRSRDPSE